MEPVMFEKHCDRLTTYGYLKAVVKTKDVQIGKKTKKVVLEKTYTLNPGKAIVLSRPGSELRSMIAGDEIHILTSESDTHENVGVLLVSKSVPSNVPGRILSTSFRRINDIYPIG